MRASYLPEVSKMTWNDFLTWVTSRGVHLLSTALWVVIIGVIGILLIRLVLRMLSRILEKS